MARLGRQNESSCGGPGKAVQQLKREPGKGLFVGGVKVPLALADLGLIVMTQLGRAFNGEATRLVRSRTVTGDGEGLVSHAGWCGWARWRTAAA